MNAIQTKLWSNKRIRIIVDGPDVRTVDLNKPYALIGTNPAADLVLPGEQIGRRKLYLHAVGDQIFCLDFAKGRARSRPTGTWISPGQPVQLGPFELLIDFSNGQLLAATDSPDLLGEGSAEPPHPLMRCAPEILPPGEFQLNRRLSLVGRGRGCHYRFDTRSVSPEHCVLYRQGKKAWVVDLQSTNTTRVEKRMMERAELSNGARLGLGKFVVTIQMPGAAPTAKAELPAAGNHASQKAAAPGSQPDQLLPEPPAGSGVFEMTAATTPGEIDTAEGPDRERLAQIEPRLVEPAPSLEELARSVDEQRQTFVETARSLDETARAFDETARALEQKSSDLEKQSSDLEKQSRQLDERYLELDQQSAELEQRSTEIEQRSAELEKQSAELEKQSAEFEKRSQQLEKQSGKLEKQSAELEKQSGQLEKRSGQLDEQSRQLDQRQQRVDATVFEFHKKREQIEQDLARAEHQLTELSEAQNRFAVEQRKSREQMNERETRLDEQEQNLQAMEVELQQAKQELEQQTDALAGEQSRMAELLASIEKSNAQCHQQLASLIENRQRLTSRMEALKATEG